MNRFWRRHVLDPISRVQDELPWFGPVVAAVVIALAVNVLTETLTQAGGIGLGWVVVGILGILAAGVVYGYQASEQGRRRRGLGSLSDLANPDRRRGLIFMFSREETLREAVNYHCPALQHCWLLVTPSMQKAAREAMGRMPEVLWTVHPLSNHYDSRACYETVRDIYLHELPRLGFESEEVIADITGGTKPMAMGLIVACLEGRYAVEHIPTAFNAAGDPTGPLSPIEVTLRETH